MARSRKVDFRCPNPVLDAITLRWKRGEYGEYKDFAKLQTAQNLYTALFPRKHDLTATIAGWDESLQDEIHDLSLRLAEAGVVLTDITGEKPVTAAGLLKLARKWTAEKLKEIKQNERPARTGAD